MQIRSVIAVFIVSLLGCSKDSSSTAPVEKPPETSSLQVAWKNFEEQHYDAAVVSFTEAYNKASTDAVRAEAIGGRGWAYAYERDFSSAKNDFVIALGFVGITNAVRNDCRVGYAFVLHALNDFAGAISFGGAVLSDQPSYVFSHDQRVTTKRVRLLLAQSYYAIGMFVSAASQMDLVDPSGAPHSSDPPTLLGTILSALNSL